ncbi:hypothetical protein BT69DRAFT_1330377 [Atractiella rhizophila]|nr:hypothetical protein BT69DRAFT_1330377 [Atractiella rhizophila]
MERILDVPPSSLRSTQRPPPQPTGLSHSSSSKRSSRPISASTSHPSLLTTKHSNGHGEGNMRAHASTASLVGRGKRTTLGSSPPVSMPVTMREREMENGGNARRSASLSGAAGNVLNMFRGRRMSGSQSGHGHGGGGSERGHKRGLSEESFEVVDIKNIPDETLNNPPPTERTSTSTLRREERRSTSTRGSKGKAVSSPPSAASILANRRPSESSKPSFDRGEKPARPPRLSGNTQQAETTLRPFPATANEPNIPTQRKGDSSFLLVSPAASPPASARNDLSPRSLPSLPPTQAEQDPPTTSLKALQTLTGLNTKSPKAIEKLTGK